MNEITHYAIHDVSRAADTSVVCLLQRVAFFGEVNPMMPTVEQIRILLAGKQYFEALETNELLTQHEPASEPLDSETMTARELARNMPGKPFHFTNSKGQRSTITMYGGF